MQRKLKITMTKAKILSVDQTEKAGLFTIIFEGEGMTEFDNFITKFMNDAERSNLFASIVYVLAIAF